MRKVFGTSFVLGLVVVGLLVPAGSAQASLQSDPFCVGTNVNGKYTGQTLKPGESCTSWPLNVNQIYVTWQKTGGGSSGLICVGLTQYGGPNHGQPVSGVPGFFCDHPNWYEGILNWRIWAYNPYMQYSYRFGQARIFNSSSATIKTVPGGFTWVAHWI
jgi:hypothetical protein